MPFGRDAVRGPGLTRGGAEAADWTRSRCRVALEEEPVRRIALAATVAALVIAAATTAGAGTAGVSIETVTPPGGPVGTQVGYTLRGTDAAGAEQCAVSSAYRLELLAPDDTLVTTGSTSVAVPEGVAPGKATIRLVCYVPDATARRVIHGMCGRFFLTDGSPPPARTGSAKVDCPSTPRIALGQSVIAVERAMSQAFNPQLYYPLSK